MYLNRRNFFSTIGGYIARVVLYGGIRPAHEAGTAEFVDFGTRFVSDSGAGAAPRGYPARFVNSGAFGLGTPTLDCTITINADGVEQTLYFPDGLQWTVGVDTNPGRESISDEDWYDAWL